MTTVDAEPTIAALDALGTTDFAAALGPLFEDAPTYLASLAAARPFGTWDGLFEAAERIALAAPERVQLELLVAHPRIGAPPATVSKLSYREQGYDQEQQDAIAALGPLNDAYEAHFGFRYVIFVAGRPRSAIVPLLEQAMDQDRDAERRRGLRDVVAIARARATALGMLQEDVNR